MRRLICLMLILLALSATSAFAFPITSFDVRMDVKPDSSIRVTEYISADFTGDPHHGIFRDIPTSGKDVYGNNHRLYFRLISVTDGFDSPVPVETSVEGGRVHLRIGDPNVLLSDRRMYVVSYRVMRGVHFFREHDELYWNVVGPDWEVPIERITCIVTLPSSIAKNQIWATAYTGYYGSRESAANWDIPDTHTARFWANKPFSPGECMTVVVGCPKGIMKQPSIMQEFGWFVTDNAYFFLPPIFLLGLIGLWWVAGRDPGVNRSEVVLYEPPDGLSPAEMGTLIDESVDVRDIAASIIDLAVRGHLTITAETGKGLLHPRTDYNLKLTKSYADTICAENITDFDSALLKAVFQGNTYCWMSSLSGTFYLSLQDLKEQLYNTLIDRGCFTHSPEMVRTDYRNAGLGIIGLAALFIFCDLQINLGIGWIIAVGICGLMLVVSSKFMPRKTRKGKETLVKIKGFEEFLSRGVGLELKYKEERGEIFEKFLPYAIALGVVDKWAHAFHGIDVKPPQWFDGYNGEFYPDRFTHDLSMASYSWGSTMSARPRTEGGSGFFGGGSGFGGGFSGGGCGGGGGGGW